MVEYKIYDTDNNFIFEGDVNQVRERFNLSPYTNLYNYYSNKSLLLKKYRVIRYENGVAINTLPKKIDNMDYIIRHLDWYGNVYMSHDPSEYLDELKKLGYVCKIDTYKVLDDMEIIVSESSKVHRKKKRNYRTDYVLTRIK